LAAMIALAPLFMDVLGTGIAGAGLAQGVSALGLSVVIWFALVRRRESLGMGELGVKAFAVRWPVWREILGIGLPVQIGRIAQFVSQWILVHLVMRDGEARVAGYGIAGVFLLFGA